jgi:ERF superfamily
MAGTVHQAPTTVHQAPTTQPAVTPPEGPLSEAQALMLMVERASRDPSVNIDKMRELLAMRKEIMNAAQEQAFNDAMARAQGEMRAVATDASNPQTHSKYASYFALDKMVRTIYTKHGFALSFDVEDGAPPDHIRLVCYVTCAGHTRKYQRDMPSDGKGAKGGDVMTKTHAMGAAQTYGQRYLVRGIFNLAIGDDTDGNDPTPRERITGKQAEDLLKKIKDIGGARWERLHDRLLTYMSIGGPRIEALADLPAIEFANAVAAIEAQRENYKSSVPVSGQPT